MEVWKPFVRNITAVQNFRVTSIQKTKPQFLTQRSEMLPATNIPIQVNLSSCFPNQLLAHFFQL